jgi:D-ribose pyranase
MKKKGVINAPISAVIAELGHMDTLTIADAGLPIPKGVYRIDLALIKGIPGFIDTLRVVLTEMRVEKVIIADEMKQISPGILTEVQRLIGDIPVDFVPHQQFKDLTKSSRAIIRTGEFTPYANIILVSGVLF